MLSYKSEAKTVNIYLDGILKKSGTPDWDSAAAIAAGSSSRVDWSGLDEFNLGGQDDYAYSGSIDDFRVYQRARFQRCN